MIPPALRTALLLIASAACAFGQADDILANNGTFKPKVTVSDRYSEKVVAEVVDDYTYRSQEPNPQSIAVSVTANLAVASVGVINADTIVGITAGHFDHSAVLGDADDYKVGLKKATFPLTKSVDLANGDTRDVKVGSVIYSWTATTLTITVACTDVVAAYVGDVAASDYVAAADVGTKENIVNDPIDVAVNFGDATGFRTVYLRGVTRTITKGYGSVARYTYEEFDLSDVTIQGSADVTPPVVKPVYPAKPNALNKLDFTGTATDLTSILMGGVIVNNVPVPVNLMGPDPDGYFTVRNVQLKKGVNVVAMDFHDEDNNTTRITKTYTIK